MTGPHAHVHLHSGIVIPLDLDEDLERQHDSIDSITGELSLQDEGVLCGWFEGIFHSIPVSNVSFVSFHELDVIGLRDIQPHEYRVGADGCSLCGAGIGHYIHTEEALEKEGSDE